MRLERRIRIEKKKQDYEDQRKMNKNEIKNKDAERSFSMRFKNSRSKEEIMEKERRKRERGEELGISMMKSYCR